MTKLKKYLFDLNFDAPDGGASQLARREMEAEDAPLPPVEEIPPPPTFSEEELTLARDQAFEAGRQAGIQEAEATTERRVATALESLAGHLAAIKDTQELANEALLKDCIALAATIIRKMLPELTRRSGTEEIEAVVHQCLTQIDKDTRVTVRLHPAEVELIREQTREIADNTSFDGKLVFTADPR
ncbi:MAG TPA: hypothetical protein HPQ04_12100, partial [Rhodospirillaceae bacterium]|nr:hypothetical protein [Rhodospirillaceae bacterium]